MNQSSPNLAQQVASPT